MSELKLEVGARVELVHDVMTGGAEPRIYARKGTRYIVDEIADPVVDGEPPVGVSETARLGADDFFDFEDLRVIASAADVENEPTEYTITGKVTVEVTHRIMAHSREEAGQKWHAMGSDLLEGWDEMNVPLVHPLGHFDIGEKGLDY